MRLLLDEHLSPKIAEELRDRGHDVVAVKEKEGLGGRADRVHFAGAPSERRAIVTRDLGDFRPLLAEAMRRGESTYGIVCVSRSFSSKRSDMGQLVKALDSFLSAHEADDAVLTRYGGEYWL